MPWPRHARRFTWALEELVAYMARSSINCTTMSRREQQKLADIQANNEALFRARLLNDALADALKYR